VSAYERRIDMTDKQCGDLTVLVYSHSTRRRMAMWLCRCKCGNLVTVSGADLRRNHQIGCLECSWERKKKVKS
jgi:hypothetical protein